MGHVPGEPENIGYVTFHFDSPLMAHVHVNWLAPVKVRRTLIGGSQKMIVYDDLEPSEKLKIYDRGISVDSSDESTCQMLVGYRTGDSWAAEPELTEALSVEAAHFLECIRQGLRPMTDGESGLRVVRLLEAASESLSQRGRLVTLENTVAGSLTRG